MHSTQQLLDAAKAASGLHSDYKLGIALGLSSDSAVTNYRKGRSHPDDKVGRDLAALAAYVDTRQADAPQVVGQRLHLAPPKPPSTLYVVR